MLLARIAAAHRVGSEMRAGDHLRDGALRQKSSP